MGQPYDVYLATPSCRFVPLPVNDWLRERCISRGPPGPRPARILLLPSPCSAVARWPLATRCHSGVLHGRGQITGPPAGPRRGAGAARRSRGHCQVPAGVLGHLHVAHKPPGPLKSTPGAWQPHLTEPRGETSATLLAAGRHLGKRPSDPLAALWGWVGALAPREAAPWTPARWRASTPETLTTGPKKET